MQLEHRNINLLSYPSWMLWFDFIVKTLGMMYIVKIHDPPKKGVHWKPCLPPSGFTGQSCNGGRNVCTFPLQNASPADVHAQHLAIFGYVLTHPQTKPSFFMGPVHHFRLISSKPCCSLTPNFTSSQPARRSGRDTVWSLQPGVSEEVVLARHP